MSKINNINKENLQKAKTPEKQRNIVKENINKNYLNTVDNYIRNNILNKMKNQCDYINPHDHVGLLFVRHFQIF